VSKQDGSGRQVTAQPTDDTSARILHLDMDAFFASVELLERPELRGRPVIVGHRGARSVVTAATYEARRYGVNSAMPMAIALRRCPNAIVLEPHYDRYTAFSRQVMGILGDVTPLVEPLSIDEAFLDVRGAVPLFGPPFAIATTLRERIRRETGLTASVGAAATKSVIIGSIIFATAHLFVDVQVVHPFWMVAFMILMAVTFCLFGFIIGIWAQSFEQLQVIPLLVVYPLTFLGGAFYSLDMLPAAWRTITLFNPVVYLISGFRWTFFGQGDVGIEVSMGAVALFLTLCLGVIFWMFRTGYRLKN